MPKTVNVQIIVNISLQVPDDARDSEIKESAWYKLFNDNDPSNWPSGTEFKIDNPG